MAVPLTGTELTSTLSRSCDVTCGFEIMFQPGSRQIMTLFSASVATPWAIGTPPFRARIQKEMPVRSHPNTGDNWLSST